MPVNFHLIIPLGEGPMPLRVTRSFHGLSIRFTILAPNRSHGVHWSRFCHRQILSDPVSDDELLNQLHNLDSSYDGNIIFPITTEGFQFVARNRKVLRKRFAIPPIASEESLKIASNKWKLFEFCKGRGFPVLPSMDLNTNALKFPILVKSRSKQGGDGFRRIDSMEAWEQFLKSLPSDKRKDYFIQPFIDGYDVSLSAYCEGGEIRSHTIWQAITYGKNPYEMPGCVQFKENETVLELGRRLLRSLNWEGICDIDFFADKHTGEVWLLEINARFWGTVLACKIAGVDFTRLMCEGALNHTIENWPQQREAVYCHPEVYWKTCLTSKWGMEISKHPLRNTGMHSALLDPGPQIYKMCAGAKWKARKLFKLIKRPKELAKRWRPALGAIFLGLQLFSIVYARFIPERFFCWAPYDEHTLYSIQVEIAGRRLSAEEIGERYRYPAHAWEVRAIHNIMNLIQQYETTYGKSDQASVVLKYETNGNPEEVWTWPNS